MRLSALLTTLASVLLPMFVALAFLLSLSPLFANSEPQITISGHQRTRTSYMRRLVSVCLEQQASERPGEPWLMTELQQCVMNSRLFSEVKAELAGDTIKLEVREKWTLIPIPAISAGSGKSRRAGAFLLESNFLGMGMTLAFGGSISNSGSSYFAALTDPSLFFTNWYYNLFINRQADDVVLNDRETEVDGFRETAIGFNTGLGYRWGRWSLAGHAGRQDKVFEVYENFGLLQDNISHRLGATIVYDRRDYKLYFSEGLSARLSAQREVSRMDHAALYRQYEGQLTWQSAVIGDQALQLLLVGGVIDGGNKTDAMRLGGGRGFRGIEAKTAWAERYHAGAIDYQVPIKSYGSGTLTTAPFLDLGRIYQRGARPVDVNYYSVGWGVYFFLKSIALPGLGFEAGYNDKYMGRFFSFSAGLSL